MKKVFTTVLPDEPYKTSVKKNITVECTYDGPRYIILRVNNEDGSIACIDKEGDDLEKITESLIAPQNLASENVFQVILDAEVHTWEAAYMTGYYTHEPFDDPTETLPTGETWTYHYDDDACAIEQPFYVNDMYYDKDTQTYKRPRYRVHAVTRKDFFAGIASQLEHYTTVLAGDTSLYTEAQVKSMQDQVAFLASIETKYPDVDHWKIPFPLFAL